MALLTEEVQFQPSLPESPSASSNPLQPPAPRCACCCFSLAASTCVRHPAERKFTTSPLSPSHALANPGVERALATADESGVLHAFSDARVTVLALTFRTDDAQARGAARLVVRSRGPEE